MEEDKTGGEEQKQDSAEPPAADKGKKQPKIWVKPGAAAPAPDTPSPPPPQGGAAPAAGASTQEAPGEKPKKQPKVWTKGSGGAAPVAQPPASAEAAAPAAGPAAKPAAPSPERKAAKTGTPAYLDVIQDPLVLRLQQEVPGAVLAAQSFLNQKILTVDASLILPVCRFLKRDPESSYDLLVDVTAVDYPEQEKRFVMVYQLYSVGRNAQLRMKCSIGEHQEIASVTSVWSTANWLEREAYDMFGIVFAGHPDLRRILLPEDWTGYPLRKDYDLRKQDEDWIRRHLQIRK